MFKDADSSHGFANGGEDLPTKFHDPDGKDGFLELGRRFMKEPDMGLSGFDSKTPKMGSHELTLSYLCENPKLGLQEKDVSGKDLLGSLEKNRYKGKEVVTDSLAVAEDTDRCVERDFLQLNEKKVEKRELSTANGEIEARNCEKKAKLETLNLSLAPPDVSLSLTSSTPLPDTKPLKKALSVQSWAPSCSDDFTVSRSYSYSHQFSHNPSCSLTRNSTENYEYSVGSHRRENDQIWYCGEGTNGSVHSRFKPVGDCINFNTPTNRNTNLHRTTSSENQSLFPSELPARPRTTHSADSRVKVLGSSDATRPNKILREIVSESIPVMAQILKEVTVETLDSVKEYLKNLLVGSEKNDELAGLQRRLERRSDLTYETLSKCHKVQLDVLVAIRTGIKSYLSESSSFTTTELIEIFLLTRCKNITCKSLLPVDDCDCKICSTKKGFCSSCMCPVCMNFDCAANTCSWVGCDVCLHWCHAMCGIQMNLIKPGPSSKGAPGTAEMQFNCLGCGHASELFGFVKEVFVYCAKDWGLETLLKELDCVRKIFQGSTDVKGKELHKKAEEMLLKLENKLISTADACNGILQYFKHGISGTSGSSSSSKDLAQVAVPGPQVEVPFPTRSSVPQDPTYNVRSSNGRIDTVRNSHQMKKESLSIEKALNSELVNYGIPKKDEFDSLETIVRIKEAEARMFQSKADEARVEAERFRKLARDGNEKLEEDYARKLAKLCLQETEERRRKKLEELKMLENSHCDYYKMKMRMEAEISSLLKRMEATKQQWV